MEYFRHTEGYSTVYKSSIQADISIFILILQEVDWSLRGKLSPLSKVQYFLFRTLKDLLLGLSDDIHNNYLHPSMFVLCLMM